MLTDFVEHGPTDKALEAAKNNIMGGFVLRLDSNQKLTEQVAGIAFYHRPLDYLSTYPERIRAVTRDEVKRAFASRIDPKKMQTILVGGAGKP